MSQEGNQGPTGTTKKPMRRLQRSMDARLWSRCCMASVITFEFLEDNTLNDSSISVLADVSAIRWLRLSENKLQLRNISFPELKNLTFLHMDNNFIESIDGQTFSSLKSLRVFRKVYDQCVLRVLTYGPETMGNHIYFVEKIIKCPAKYGKKDPKNRPVEQTIVGPLKPLFGYQIREEEKGENRREGGWVDHIAKFDCNWVGGADDSEDWRSRMEVLCSAVGLVRADNNYIERSIDTLIKSSFGGVFHYLILTFRRVGKRRYNPYEYSAEIFLKQRQKPLIRFFCVFWDVKSTFIKAKYLRDMEISNLAIRTFKETEKLKIIHFKKFRYCSFAPHVRICEPRTDGLSSTEHLLVKPILRVCVWVVAAVTCIGNFLVLLGRFLATHDEPGRMSMMFIKNLSFADLLMGIYLCVVASKDIMFRDNYMKYAHEWMSSHWCVCCGILAMTASEVSVLTLSFMSIERHFRIVNPFRVRLELHQRSAYISMILIWGSGITLAIIPTIPWMHQRDRHNFYGNNGLCFPLHISDPFIPGWQYSAFIFFGINFMGVLIIAITYISMYISIQHTRSKTPQRTGELEVAKRFFLIILTNCLCWIPIIILKLLALTGVKISEAFKDQHYLNYEISWPRDNMKFHEVSNLWYYMSLDDVINDLHAWIVIFILPVNSAMNPIIYTLSSKEFKKKVKTFANKSRLFWWLPSRRSTIRSERSMSSTRTMSTRTSSGFGSVRIVAKREMGVKLAAAGPRRHTTHIPAISEDFI
ncbi:Relaxin receptor 2 [Nymphon striatum]|nr:Relaxin receptor 2 [Nymphon striatum]